MTCDLTDRVKRLRLPIVYTTLETALTFWPKNKEIEENALLENNAAQCIHGALEKSGSTYRQTDGAKMN